MKCGHTTQRGFAAIAAIFLVVILAALGGFMLTFSNSQQLTSAQDVQGSRAYWAALAGLEWGVASLPSGSTACWANQSFVVDGFTVNVTCSTPATSYTDGTATVRIFQLTSVASTGGVGTLGFVERSVSASLER